MLANDLNSIDVKMQNIANINEKIKDRLIKHKSEHQ